MTTQEIDTDYLYLCEKEKDLEQEQNGLFTTDQNVLSAESWNLLLRKKADYKNFTTNTKKQSK